MTKMLEIYCLTYRKCSADPPQRVRNPFDVGSGLVKPTDTPVDVQSFGLKDPLMPLAYLSSLGFHKFQSWNRVEIELLLASQRLPARAFPGKDLSMRTTNLVPKLETNRWNTRLCFWTWG